MGLARHRWRRQDRHILDTPTRSALLLGAGVLGTVLGQFGMLWAWRRYVRATD
ncbi:MAG: hypothetical protein ACT4PE_14940 [Candidatus Eiseniibacteriota bacterium]